LDCTKTSNTLLSGYIPSIAVMFTGPTPVHEHVIGGWVAQLMVNENCADIVRDVSPGAQL
jgi:hypothetical protein